MKFSLLKGVCRALVLALCFAQVGLAEEDSEESQTKKKKSKVFLNASGKGDVAPEGVIALILKQLIVTGTDTYDKDGKKQRKSFGVSKKRTQSRKNYPNDLFILHWSFVLLRIDSPTSAPGRPDRSVACNADEAGSIFANLN